MSNCECIIESMLRYVGQTVTIFTTSGGLSGSGFTGVLAGVHNGCIRLITDIGAPPACPVGSSCAGFLREDFDGVGPGFGGGCGGGCGGRRGWGWGSNWRGSCGCGWGSNRWGWGGYNWLGSVAEIPCDKIVSFTHNAI